MARRAAAGVARFLPVLLIAGALLITGVAVVVAACGDGISESPTPTVTVTVTASPTAAPSTSPSSPSASPSPVANKQIVTLYFVRDGELCAVARRLSIGDSPGEAVVKALLKGPTAAEEAAGVTSAIPSGTRLVEFSADGVAASVAVSSRFARADDTTTVRLRMAQLVYTVSATTSASAHATIALRVGDEDVYALPTSEGETKYFQTRRGYTGLEPAIFVESPGLGATITSPFVLRGSASVFEGSFVARLVDSSGRRIVNLAVQASRGAPLRGRFKETVPYSTSATAGTLIVYSVSMEDGSHQDEVRIPVEFGTE